MNICSHISPCANLGPSENGRIVMAGKFGAKRKRIDPLIRFMKKVRKQDDGCWIWTASTNPRGYGIFARIDGVVLEVAHRSAYHLLVGPIPDGKLVLHKCDVRLCVNPEHLFLGSASDNTMDMCLKWRTKSKFTEKDVREIRASGESASVLASRFGCHKSTIKLVKARKTFAYVS